LNRQCVDTVAELCAKHVVDEAVLGDARQAIEGRSGDHGVEVVTVTRDLSASPGNGGLDTLFKLIGTNRHALKRSGVPALYFVKP
jgi:hypothetical protein